MAVSSRGSKKKAPKKPKNVPQTKDLPKDSKSKVSRKVAGSPPAKKRDVSGKYSGDSTKKTGKGTVPVSNDDLDSQSDVTHVSPSQNGSSPASEVFDSEPKLRKRARFEMPSSPSSPTRSLTASMSSSPSSAASPRSPTPPRSTPPRKAKMKSVSPYQSGYSYSYRQKPEHKAVSPPRRSQHRHYDATQHGMGSVEDDMYEDWTCVQGTPGAQTYWADPSVEQELCRLWEEEVNLYDLQHPDHRNPLARKASQQRIAAVLHVPCK
jgi:hypothetical protein